MTSSESSGCKVHRWKLTKRVVGDHLGACTKMGHLRPLAEFVPRSVPSFPRTDTSFPVSGRRSPVPILRSPALIRRSPALIRRSPTLILRPPALILRSPTLILRSPELIRCSPVPILRSPTLILRSPPGLVRVPPHQDFISEHADDVSARAGDVPGLAGVLGDASLIRAGHGPDVTERSAPSPPGSRLARLRARQRGAVRVSSRTPGSHKGRGSAARAKSFCTPADEPRAARTSLAADGTALT